MRRGGREAPRARVVLALPRRARRALRDASVESAAVLAHRSGARASQWRTMRIHAEVAGLALRSWPMLGRLPAVVVVPRWAPVVVSRTVVPAIAVTEHAARSTQHAARSTQHAARDVGRMPRVRANPRRPEAVRTASAPSAVVVAVAAPAVAVAAPTVAVVAAVAVAAPVARRRAPVVVPRGWATIVAPTAATAAAAALGWPTGARNVDGDLAVMVCFPADEGEAQQSLGPVARGEGGGARWALAIGATVSVRKER